MNRSRCAAPHPFQRSIATWNTCSRYFKQVSDLTLKYKTALKGNSRKIMNYFEPWRAPHPTDRVDGVSKTHMKDYIIRSCLCGFDTKRDVKWSDAISEGSIKATCWKCTFSTFAGNKMAQVCVCIVSLFLVWHALTWMDSVDHNSTWKYNMYTVFVYSKGLHLQDKELWTVSKRFNFIFI